MFKEIRKDSRLTMMHKITNTNAAMKRQICATLGRITAHAFLDFYYLPMPDILLHLDGHPNYRDMTF